MNDCYDSLGQVTSGKKYWVDGTPVAGQQFDYAFDTIGNRNSTKSGGDETGANQRVASYTNNTLNQVTGRDVPGYVDIKGISIATNTVTVAGLTAYRKGEYFRKELFANNTNALWTNIVVAANGQTSATGNVFLAKAPEVFTYDLDGNLIADGRWSYNWDAENRLTNMTSLSSAPAGSKLKLDFVYDSKGRRIQKIVSTNNGSAYVGQSTNKFVYDGWNLIAVLNPVSALVSSYVWGTDLSGSQQGAGGVGGLLEVANYGISTNFVTYDGNGNVAALVKASDGTVTANYEYGPFGEVIRATGLTAKSNPFRFSSKYQDDESDLVYYGYRFYNQIQGRWLSRDPLTDQVPLMEKQDDDKDDKNHLEPESAPMLFVNNNPISSYDPLGLWPSSSPFLGFLLGGMPLTHQNAIHRAIPGLSFNDEQWLDVATVYVDTFQKPVDSYRHAMRNGRSREVPAHARQFANDFVRNHLENAEKLLCSQCSDPFARGNALLEFGQALHTIQDSTSPAHYDFQAWHGLGLNPINYERALRHVIREDFDPGPGSQLDQATTWLWGFFLCKDNAPVLPSDFFSEFGYDTKY